MDTLWRLLECSTFSHCIHKKEAKSHGNLLIDRKLPVPKYSPGVLTPLKRWQQNALSTPKQDTAETSTHIELSFGISRLRQGHDGIVMASDTSTATGECQKQQNCSCWAGLNVTLPSFLQVLRQTTKQSQKHQMTGREKKTHHQRGGISSMEILKWNTHQKVKAKQPEAF